MSEAKTRIAVIGAPSTSARAAAGSTWARRRSATAACDERLAAIGHARYDHGNVIAPTVERLDQGDPSARYWDAIKHTCEELAARGRQRWSQPARCRWCWAATTRSRSARWAGSRVPTGRPAA